VTLSTAGAWAHWVVPTGRLFINFDQLQGATGSLGYDVESSRTPPSPLRSTSPARSRVRGGRLWRCRRRQQRFVKIQAQNADGHFRTPASTPEQHGLVFRLKRRCRARYSVGLVLRHRGDDEDQSAAAGRSTATIMAPASGPAVARHLRSVAWTNTGASPVVARYKRGIWIRKGRPPGPVPVEVVA